MGSYVYASVEAASKGLLGETCSILNNIDMKYVIVGGWCPYLRSDKQFNHPGTRDIDILFDDNMVKQDMEKAIISLLDAGFIPSAKHSFQMLKSFPLASNNPASPSTHLDEMLFNIDLLHPSETKRKGELLQDWFDLGINERDLDGRLTVKARSMALPSSKLLFDNMFDMAEVEYHDRFGNLKKIKFPLINYLGLLLSKARSVSSEKRERDAFDIFLVFMDKEFESFVKYVLQYMSAEDAPKTAVKEAIEPLLRFLNDSNNASKFDSNVRKYYPQSGNEVGMPSQIAIDGLKRMGFSSV